MSPWPGSTSPVSGSSTPARMPQQRGLAGAVEAEDHDAAALVDGQVDVGEDLERAVGLRQLARRQRRLAARRRLRERDLGDLVGDLRSSSRPASSRSARFIIDCAAWALVALARILLAWSISVSALLSALARSRLRRRSSVSRCARYGRPADVVDVDLGAVGVEVEHPVDARPRAAPTSWLITTSPPWWALRKSRSQHDRVGVEVVGRLVEEQRLGAGEQDAGQLDPSPLATGQGAAAVGRAPGRRGRGSGRSARPRPRRRSRRRACSSASAARSGASPGPADAGSSLPISLSASRSRRTTSSSPRADRMRSRASTSGSPVRGSCGQVADRARGVTDPRRAGRRRPGSWSAWSCPRRCDRPARSCRPARPGR